MLARTLLMLALLCSLCGIVRAQGTGGTAGSSVGWLSLQLPPITFSQLPGTVTNGRAYYLSDGTAGSPCTGGGSGAIALGINGAWSCINGTSSGGGGGGNATITTLGGTTAGNAYWSEPWQGNAAKQVVLNFQGYENSTGSAQIIVYPTAYTYAPAALGSCPAGLILSNVAQVSLPVSMTSTFTGQCVLEGQ